MRPDPFLRLATKILISLGLLSVWHPKFACLDAWPLVTPDNSTSLMHYPGKVLGRFKFSLHKIRTNIVSKTSSTRCEVSQNSLLVHSMIYLYQIMEPCYYIINIVSLYKINLLTTLVNKKVFCYKSIILSSHMRKD